MLCNRSRALAQMRRCQVEALIATSQVNVTYFTGYYCWLDRKFKEYMTKPGAPADFFQTWALLPAEGEPALVMPVLMGANALGLGIGDLRCYGDPGLDLTQVPLPLSGELEGLYQLLSAPQPESAVEALAAVLRERGLASAVIGLEMEDLPARTLEGLRRALPKVQFKDCSNLIRLIRMVKSQEEIQRLARAAQIAEDAAKAGLSQLRPGKSFLEASRIFRSEIAGQGADLDHFAYSPRGLGIATEPDYLLPADEVMYVDYGCMWGNYCSDSGLTLALRPLEGELARRYTALRQCLAAGVAAMRPGARASQVHHAMKDFLKAEGITASYPHGHGVGLEIRDYPVLVPDTGLRVRDDCVDEPADLLLEEDMMLNLEAMIFTHGAGSLHIERSFVVGAQETRPLIPQDRQEPFVPG
jgi:Xaa-Pro dipeptidase